jgi:hypothetical protein
MTVREMMSKLDSLELSEWQAYFALQHAPEEIDPEAAVKDAKAIFGGNR